MSFGFQLRRFFLGQPLPTSAHTEERLGNAAALAILASDALSSVAYATEEILLVLVTVGSSVLSLSLPIASAIVLLLAIVILSYRQTIRAYPNGGGAYIVVRENLGLYLGLVAGAALLIDYILTVTVSVSAGIAALTSAFPVLSPWGVDICLLAVFLLMWANLRGVKEAGRIFMIPTYAFIVSIFLLIGVGLFRHATGNVSVLPESLPPATETLSLFLVLRAFAAGCTALTGVEAISDGVLVFKLPEWKNARRTLIYMGTILGMMFLGITYLVNAYQIVPTHEQTVVSLLGRQVFGNGLLYYELQGATLLILLLAANTSYSDFPRLGYFLARDGFLPRQLALLGDRLVYANGIRLLSLAAAFLIIIFQGQVNALIPLYAVGVFTSFTLSQSGMVLHWFKEKSSNWRPSALMNGLGAITTGVVLAVIVATKFLLGAWIVVITIPILVSLFLAIHRHYQTVAEKLRLTDIPRLRPIHRAPNTEVNNRAVVLIGQLHRGTVEALEYALTIADEVVAVHVDVGKTNQEKLRQQWDQLDSNISLVILESPYRSVVSPLVEFVSEFESAHPGLFSTVIIPVFVTHSWWEELLHNQTALFLRARLRVKRSRVVTTFRYYL